MVGEWWPSRPLTENRSRSHWEESRQEHKIKEARQPLGWGLQYNSQWNCPGSMTRMHLPFTPLPVKVHWDYTTSVPSLEHIWERGGDRHLIFFCPHWLNWEDQYLDLSGKAWNLRYTRWLGSLPKGGDHGILCEKRSFVTTWRLEELTVAGKMSCVYCIFFDLLLSGYK